MVKSSHKDSLCPQKGRAHVTQSCLRADRPFVSCSVFLEGLDWQVQVLEGRSQDS